MSRRQWHPLFTREYPLYIADMAAAAFLHLMESEIGWGYRDALFIGQRGMLTAHYSDDDAKRFQKFCRGQPPRFFSVRNAGIRHRAEELTSEVRRFKHRRQTDKFITTFPFVHAAYQRLYAVYRFSPMVEFAARVTRKRVLDDCARTKEMAGRAIKHADRAFLPWLSVNLHRLGGMPKQLALSARADEIRVLAASGRSPVSISELRKRFQRFVHYSVSGRSVMYSGARAENVIARLNIISANTLNTQFITGQTAEPGFVRGSVVIVQRATDLKKVRRGRIFVAPMTLPTHIPWIKKAAAIVTDEGGITSHAAIVSRELGVPCIIGTKIATQVLKDGDTVEVDATKGVVKVLKRA